MNDSDATKPLRAADSADQHGLRRGDRIRILKGEHAGREGVLCKSEPSATWGMQYFVRLDRDSDWCRLFAWDFLGPVESPRRVPLLEYLDKLESIAKAAPQGDWAAPNGGWPGSLYGEIVTNEQPFDDGYGGKLIAESCKETSATHIVAMQPKIALALIAKLREAMALVRVIGDGDADTPQFERRWRALNEIEVPE